MESLLQVASATILMRMLFLLLDCFATGCPTGSPLHRVTVWYCSKGSFIALCGVMWVSAADSLSKVSSPPPTTLPRSHLLSHFIVTVSRCHQACLPVSLCLERRVGLRVDGTVVLLLTHDTGWREKKWRLKKPKHIPAR